MRSNVGQQEGREYLRMLTVSVFGPSFLSRLALAGSFARSRFGLLSAVLALQHVIIEELQHETEIL